MTLSSADGEFGGPVESAQPQTAQTQPPAQMEPQKKEKSTGRRAPPAEGSRPLDKKRARDRRAQQALRDRTRSTIHNMSEQVATLTRVVEQQSQELSVLRERLDAVSTENAILRKQMVADRASHQVDNTVNTVVGAAATSPSSLAPWETPPLNSAPTSIADQLFQGFVDVQRRAVAQSPPSAATSPSSASPDITPLLDRRRRGTDEVSKVASDVVRTYAEIETLPKQIAVHFLMTHLLKVFMSSLRSLSFLFFPRFARFSFCPRFARFSSLSLTCQWLVLLDEPSWNSVPVWLRPTRAQRTVEHPPWIDRIPW